ncbi:MAG: hypothetical protein LBH01_06530 [Verrucomicrobiales bacterium]|jgi:hypothetical protein|nr:hypothetical protein [Verrucomicrobiales bacterium]
MATAATPDPGKTIPAGNKNRKFLLNQPPARMGWWSHGFEPTDQYLKQSNNQQVIEKENLALSEKVTVPDKVIQAWPLLPEIIKESIILIVNQFMQQHNTNDVNS